MEPSNAVDGGGDGAAARNERDGRKRRRTFEAIGGLVIAAVALGGGIAIGTAHTQAASKPSQTSPTTPPSFAALTPEPSDSDTAAADSVDSSTDNAESADQSGACTLYQKTENVVVYVSGDGVGPGTCAKDATDWTRQALGTTTYWLSADGKATYDYLHPGTPDRTKSQVCRGTSGGTSMTIYDTGGAYDGNQICSAMESSGWTVT